MKPRKCTSHCYQPIASLVCGFSRGRDGSTEARGGKDRDDAKRSGGGGVLK